MNNIINHLNEVQVYQQNNDTINSVITDNTTTCISGVTSVHTTTCTANNHTTNKANKAAVGGYDYENQPLKLSRHQCKYLTPNIVFEKVAFPNVDEKTLPKITAIDAEERKALTRKFIDYHQDGTVIKYGITSVTEDNEVPRDFIPSAYDLNKISGGLQGFVKDRLKLLNNDVVSIHEETVQYFKSALNAIQKHTIKCFVSCFETYAVEYVNRLLKFFNEEKMHPVLMHALGTSTNFESTVKLRQYSKFSQPVCLFQMDVNEYCRNQFKLPHNSKALSDWCMKHRFMKVELSARRSTSFLTRLQSEGYKQFTGTLKHHMNRVSNKHDCKGNLVLKKGKKCGGTKSFSTTQTIATLASNVDVSKNDEKERCRLSSVASVHEDSQPSNCKETTNKNPEQKIEGQIILVQNNVSTNVLDKTNEQEVVEEMSVKSDSMQDHVKNFFLSTHDNNNGEKCIQVTNNLKTLLCDYTDHKPMTREGRTKGWREVREIDQLASFQTKKDYDVASKNSTRFCEGNGSNCLLPAPDNKASNSKECTRRSLWTNMRYCNMCSIAGRELSECTIWCANCLMKLNDGEKLPNHYLPLAKNKKRKRK